MELDYNLTYEVSESKNQEDSDQLCNNILQAFKERNQEKVFNLCDRCKSETAALDLLRSIENFSKENVELFAMIFYYFADKGWSNVNMNIKRVCGHLLSYPNNRLVRKTALAALKAIVTEEGSTFWSDYFIVLSALEEPQFHLVHPVLPKVDNLLHHLNSSYSSPDSFICWDWMEFLLSKALVHSNGWIRSWTAEKIISIDAQKFAHNPLFLVHNLFPVLGDNDVYWRFLDKDCLDNFIEGFTSFLQDIVDNIGAIKTQEYFFEEIIATAADLKNAGPMFFFSQYLANLAGPKVFRQRHLSCFKRILNAVNNVPYRLIKISATLNFIAFFVKHVQWDLDSIWDFVPIFQFLWHLETIYSKDGLVEFMSKKILSSWEATSEEMYAEPESIVLEYFKRVRVDYSTDFCVSCARVAWIAAERCKLSNSVLNLLIYDIRKLEQNLFVDGTEALTIISLTAPAECFARVDRSTLSDFRNFLITFWETRLFGLKRTFSWEKLDFLFTKAVSFLEKSVDSWYLKIQNMLLEAGRTRESEERAFAILNAMRGTCFETADYWSIVKSFSETGMSSVLERFGSGEQLSADLGLSPLHFLLMHLSFVKNVKDELLQKCVVILKKVAVWEGKSLLFQVIGKILKEVKSKDLLVAAADVISASAKEEKNSRNYLKAVELLLSVLLQEELLVQNYFSEYVLKIIVELADTATLNVQVLYLISTQLTKVWKCLSSCWISLITHLCLFGFIPSRDMKITCAAIHRSLISSSFGQFVELQQLNVEKQQLKTKAITFRLHSVVQYARFQSFVVAMNLCSMSSQITTLFLERILNAVEEIDNLRNRSFGLSMGHRQKTRVMQLLLILVDYFEGSDLKKLYDHCCVYVVEETQQYSVKLLVEWILIRILYKDSGLFNDFIECERKFARKRIGSMTSWINVIMHVAKMDINEDRIGQCFQLFLPWCTAQNFSIRCSAIAALLCLWSVSSEKLRSSFCYLETVITFDGEPAGNARRVIKTLCDDFYFAAFHPDKHYNMQVILEIFPRKTGLPEEELIPAEIFKDMLLDDEKKFSFYETDKVLKGSPSLIFSNLAKKSHQQILLSITSEAGDPGSKSGDVQRKIDGVKGKWEKPKNKSLIVVASLVDKATNLGGICRTCEVFGVEKLVLSDFNVLNQQDFQALSTSSEKWIDLEQVRSSQLIQYLKSRREEGFAIIAAEQSAHSISFADFRFPEKSLILLGDEKEGVPIDLIRFVDIIVEIPQFGQTRSLNVHVTAALFIQKYSDNHYLK